MSEVPEGTIAEVLAWVDGDPARAQQALDAENDGSGRVSLINQLEPIAARQEAPVSDPAATADDRAVEADEDGIVREEGVEPYPEGNAPPPQPPTGDDLVIDVADRSTVVGPANQRTPDVEIPEDSYDKVAAEAQANDEEAPVEASTVDFFQLASSGGVVVIRFDGATVLLDAQQAVALQRDLRQALANATY